MAKQLKLKRGTTSQHGSFTGAEGEVTVDTDKETLVVHDGSTAGGHPVAAEDMANVSSASIAGRLSNDSIAVGKIAAGTLPSDVKIADANVSGNLTIESADIVNGTIVNADVNASAAIDGTKIDPDFGSQNIVTTGTLGSSDITVTGATPIINLTENDGNPDYRIAVDAGRLRIQDTTNGNVSRLDINTDGHVDVTGNLDVGAGIDVTGNMTVTGTVDGVDIATRDTLFGGLTSSSGVLTNGVTATTQSQGDGSTKVATTAYTDTAVSNLVDSSPAALNTLNELAAAIGDDANFSTTITNSIGTKLPKSGGEMSGNITMAGSQTVDGRDLSVDGAKLDGIESGATADQTNAEIRAAVEAASDSNVFTDADHSKLNGIASSANNYSHPNHSGEVTSSGDGAMTIADNVVDEANLKVSNSPTNGYYLQAQSGNTGGLTWAQVAEPDLTNLSASNMTSGTLPDARFPATLPAISGANLTNLPGGGKVTRVFIDTEGTQYASSSNTTYLTVTVTNVPSTSTRYLIYITYNLQPQHQNNSSYTANSIYSESGASTVGFNFNESGLRVSNLYNGFRFDTASNTSNRTYTIQHRATSGSTNKQSVAQNGAMVVLEIDAS